MGNCKTVRLTPRDLVAAEELAELLGVPCSELVAEFEQLTPEELAELERVIEQANEVLPAMHASLDRVAMGLAHCRTRVCEMQE